MKRIAVVFLIVGIILSITASSSFAWKGGFRGGGGGVFLGWITPDLGPINNEIIEMGNISELDDGFVVIGGRGYGYVNRNFRIGGGGAGGWTTTSGMTPADPVNNIPALDKEITFSMGYGGVTLEYVYDLPFGLQMFGGGMIGGGGASIDIGQYESRSWGSIWDNYQFVDSTNYTQTITMERGFMLIDPWMGIHFNILDWMAVSGKVGYFFPLLESDWKINDTEMFGAPDIDLANWHFDFAILFGG